MPNEDFSGPASPSRTEGAGKEPLSQQPLAVPRFAQALERERLGQTIGKIGGKPRLKGKVLNAVFVVAVCGAFAMSLLTTGTYRAASIDIGLLLLSLKFAYHLHTEAKVNHAQFWILNAIEDRLLDAIRELRQLRSEFRNSSAPRHENPLPDNATTSLPNPSKED